MAFSQNLAQLESQIDTARCMVKAYCLANSPPTHSPLGRGVWGLRIASMILSACFRTAVALAGSEYSSKTKNNCIKSQPMRHPSGMCDQLTL